MLTPNGTETGSFALEVWILTLSFLVLMRVVLTENEATVLWEKFRISREFGFLEPEPLKRLPEEFASWMDACDKMVELIENGTVREYLDNLPELSTESLESHEELRLAHTLLVTMTSGYVWGLGIDNACNLLPRQIAVPLHAVSHRLDVLPVVSHAAVEIANWQKIDKNDKFDAENLELIAFKFLPMRGFEWFFIITAQIEKDFAPAIYSMAQSCLHEERLGRADSRDDDERVLQEQRMQTALVQIQESLKKAIGSFKRMRDHLTPSDFYNKVRPFLWGYNEGAIKESGILFEGLEHLGPQKHAGATGAQSSTLPLCDAFLGVEHHGEHSKFLEVQRKYMPAPHRRLLKWVASNRPKFSNAELYNETLDAVRAFRSEHIKMVSLFILCQLPPNKSATGTGGSSFMTFLKSIRADGDKCVKENQ